MADTLLFAAREIVDKAAPTETVADVLRARTLQRFHEGLRQYIAVRLRDPAEAARRVRLLRGAVASLGADELTAPPGVRARLYRIARDLASDAPPHSGTAATFPWCPPAPGAASGFARSLAALRSGLDAGDAEVLELRHARGLADAEVAHVLGIEASEAAARHASAMVRAAALAGAETPTGLEGTLAAAFAIEPGGDEFEEPEAPGDARATEAGRLAPGTLVGERYRIVKFVDGGAFGEVYRAQDTEVREHIVALKILLQPSLSQDARDAATAELRNIASVFHPSIVNFKDSGWHDARLWFVMPWYEGETLERRIERTDPADSHARVFTPLSRANARAVFEPVARALATLHAAGIRHQDVKPANIFLARVRGFVREGDDEILPVLLDLGVAAKESEMVLAGTPLYFPPEVAWRYALLGGKAPPLTARADVFSLALALRDALEPETRDRIAPDASDHEFNLFLGRRAKEPVPAPLGRDLAYLAPHFARWLSPDPARRPAADEFAAELAVLTAPEEQRARRNRTLRWFVPLMLVLAVVVGAAGMVLSQATKAERARREASEARRQATELRDAVRIARLREEGDDERRRRLEAEGHIREMDTRLQRQDLTQTELRELIAVSRADMRALQGQLDARASQLRDSEARVATVTREKDSALRDLEASRAETRARTAERDQRTGELRDMRAEATALAAQRDLARAEAQARTQERDERAGEIASARAETQARAQERDQARTELQARVTERDEARTERDEARTEREERAAELARTRAALETCRRAPPPAVGDGPPAPPVLRPPVVAPAPAPTPPSS